MSETSAGDEHDAKAKELLPCSSPNSCEAYRQWSGEPHLPECRGAKAPAVAAALRAQAEETRKAKAAYAAIKEFARQEAEAHKAEALKLIRECDDADDLRAQIAQLKGVIAADDARLRDAAVRVWGEHIWGCDTPDHMADEIAQLKAEVDKWRLALEGLTPGGSEYVNDVQRCVDFVRNTYNAPVRVIAQLKAEVESWIKTAEIHSNKQLEYAEQIAQLKAELATKDQQLIELGQSRSAHWDNERRLKAEFEECETEKSRLRSIIAESVEIKARLEAELAAARVENERLHAQDAEWIDVIAQIGRYVGCLASHFSDGNGHVVKKVAALAIAAKIEAENAKTSKAE